MTTIIGERKPQAITRSTRVLYPNLSLSRSMLLEDDRPKLMFEAECDKTDGVCPWLGPTEGQFYQDYSLVSFHFDPVPSCSVCEMIIRRLDLRD